MRDSGARGLLWRGIGVLLLCLSVAGLAAAEPLKIRYALWVGYGPLFLAQERGYFKAENVDVRLVNVEDTAAGFLAMSAGQVDGVVSTVDAMILYLKTGKELQYVLALDDSAGGDGIIARSDIRSVRDLRGKRVAVHEGSVSQFFLNVLLREAGLSEKDIRIVNMLPGDAGVAFFADKVDAAVTWEPWLSKGKTAPHGRLLVDSSRTPGLITDALIFRRDVIEKRPGDVQGVVNAWNRAVTDWEKNPAAANEIMARAVGGWLKDPRVFADVLTGVRFYNQAGNVKFFGTPQTPGDLYRVVQNALDIWGGFGKLQGRFLAKDLINHSFVK